MKEIHALIIDDEPAAVDVIKELAKQLARDVVITGVATNGIDALKLIISQKPDLVFLDVDMPMMNGLELMEKLPDKNFKIIFTTGSAEYAFKAIKLKAVDYLLKPIDPADFLIAIEKVRSELRGSALPAKEKSRLVVKKGIENISMKLEDIALFYTENRVTYAMDRHAKKFLTDQNMNELEGNLPHNLFYRANRQYIINLNFIKTFKPYEKVKLLVELSVPEINHVIIISQKKAPEFRTWVSGF